MNRFLLLAPLVLLPAYRIHESSPASAANPRLADRPLASLVPRRCQVFVDGSGLRAHVARGLDDPFVRAFFASEIGRLLLERAPRTPEEALAIADAWLGAPALAQVAELIEGGIALGADLSSGAFVVLARGRDEASTAAGIGRILDGIESSLGLPGVLDRPTQSWSGAEVWSLGESLLARRGALVVLGNHADLLKEALQLASDPEGRGLLERASFATSLEQSARQELWAWAELEEIDAHADAGFRELRAAPRSPAFLALLGSGLASVVSSPALSAGLRLEDHALTLSLVGHGAEGAPLALPSRAGAVPPETRTEGDLARALLYRDYSGLFTRRTELFPPEVLPGFAEAITNGALFFQGMDLGEDVLARVSPWLRVVARNPTFAEARGPEIPLPGLVLTAVLDDEALGDDWVTAFQSVVAITNVDRAQKGGSAMRLRLEREGETEISLASFPAPRPEDGIDLRYNLEPAIAVVGRLLVLGTHVSLVREAIRGLTGQALDGAQAGAESLQANGAPIARAVERNLETLVVQKMLEDGLSRAEAEGEIAGLGRLLASLAEVGVEVRTVDPREPEATLRLVLAPAGISARSESER